MMKKKKVLAYAMVGVLILSLVPGCPVLAKGSLVQGSKSTGKKKVGLNKKHVTLTVGKQVKLRVKGAGKVKWSSSKKSVASVTNKGVVKGKKAGKAKVTAKAGKKKYTCTVTVKAKSTGKNTGATAKVKWDTVSSKFTKLADYVTANGQETEEGISLVKTEKDDGAEITVRVSYNSDDEALIFEKTEDDGDDEGYTILMTITKEDAQTADIECQISQSGTTYVGVSEIEVAEYIEEDDSLGFDFDGGSPTTDEVEDTTEDTDTSSDTDSDDGAVSSPSDDVAEELDSLGTDYLNDALSEWNTYLTSVGSGVSLKDLGFISYDFS